MKVNELVGVTLTKIDTTEDEMIFYDSDGNQYRFWHSQGCCANVSIEDVIGDLNDLIGTPLTMAEVVESTDNPDGVVKDYQNSFTWTFYKFATIKGYVTVRWYGESNGCYSESVDFAKL